MKKTALAATLAFVAALAMSGCTIAATTADVATQEQASAQGAQIDTRADEVIDHWLYVHGANTLNAMGYPYQTVDSWETEGNDFIAHTANGGSVELDMQIIAENIKFNAPDWVGTVTVVNEDGESVTYPS